MDRESTATRIRKAYGSRIGSFVTVTEIADAAGLGADELHTGILYLMDTDEMFRAEPESHRHRLTDRDRELAPVIGGEARHKICWYR